MIMEEQPERCNTKSMETDSLLETPECYAALLTLCFQLSETCLGLLT